MVLYCKFNHMKCWSPILSWLLGLKSIFFALAQNRSTIWRFWGGVFKKFGNFTCPSGHVHHCSFLVSSQVSLTLMIEDECNLKAYSCISPMRLPMYPDPPVTTITGLLLPNIWFKRMTLVDGADVGDIFHNFCFKFSSIWENPQLGGWAMTIDLKTGGSFSLWIMGSNHLCTEFLWLFCYQWVAEITSKTTFYNDQPRNSISK